MTDHDKKRNDLEPSQLVPADADSDAYRRRALEEERKAQEEKEQQELEELEEFVDDLDALSGYDKEQSKGFDPLTKGKETEEEVEREKDLERDISLGRQRELKHKSKKAKSAWRLLGAFVKNMTEALFKKMDMMQQGISSTIRRVSTYRHHSLNSPMDQPGTFDNKGQETKSEVQTIKDRIAKEKSEAALKGLAAEEVDHGKLGQINVGKTPFSEKIEQEKGGGRGV